jgi:hypothetical protein
MANTYLTRTSGTPTLNTKYTLSFWVKRSNITYSECFIFDGRIDASNRFKFAFDANDKINCFNSHSGLNTIEISSNRVFRDTSAWYHIVLSVDTTQLTAADRVKLYVNGVQETSFSSVTYPSQNDANNVFNENSSALVIGAYYNGTNPFDGLLSHVHFVDGTAYAASTFGSTDSTTGEWKINTNPSITMGNNGFTILKDGNFTILKDGNTITDQSSNSNDFTLGGGTLTNTEDCPSNVFCTFNGVNPYSGVLSNGNLKMAQTNFDINVQGTLGMESGKYYWEYKIDGLYGEFGVCEQGKAGQSDPQSNIGFYFLYNNGNTTGYIFNNATAGSQSSQITIPAFASGMIINLAYDADNKALYIGQNGTWLNSGDPTSGASTTGALITNLYPRFGGTIVPFCGHGTSSTTANYFRRN